MVRIDHIVAVVGLVSRLAVKNVLLVSILLILHSKRCDLYTYECVHTGNKLIDRRREKEGTFEIIKSRLVCGFL